jgi:hypothetical protein
MGKITYCIVDETDPSDVFECEGEVIRTFFSTMPIFMVLSTFCAFFYNPIKINYYHAVKWG